MIHVQLSSEIEARLRAQTRAHGIETDSHAKALIEDAVRAAPIADRRSAEGRNIAAFFKVTSADSEKIPELPAEAFARASFYDDRG